MDEKHPFNLELGLDLKHSGIERAAAAVPDWLKEAKRIAQNIGQTNGECCADDVNRVLLELYGIESIGPAAGSLFRNKKLWSCTGRVCRSHRVKSHAGKLYIWKYIGDTT